MSLSSSLGHLISCPDHPDIIHCRTKAGMHSAWTLTFLPGCTGRVKIDFQYVHTKSTKRIWNIIR